MTHVHQGHFTYDLEFRNSRWAVPSNRRLTWWLLMLALLKRLEAFTVFIVHSTKLLNFDWSRAVQLIPNCIYSVGVPIKFPWKRRNFVECTINKKSHDLLVQFVNSWFWKFSNCTRLKARAILRTFKITRTYFKSRIVLEIGWFSILIRIRHSKDIEAVFR